MFISESDNCESLIKSTPEHSDQYMSMLNDEEANSRFSFQDKKKLFCKVFCKISLHKK